MKPKETVILLISIIVVFFAIYKIPIAPDWNVFGRLDVRDPYMTPAYFNTPWLAWIIAPFTFIPDKLGCTLWRLMSLIAMLYAMRRFEISGWKILPILISPPFLAVLWNAQVDGILLLGMSFYGSLGIIAAATKPQIGIGSLVYHVRTKNFRAIASLIIVIAVSFIIYGMWPLRMSGTIWRDGDVIGPLQPYLFGIGVSIMILSLHKKKYDLSVFTSPLLSPYGMLHSLIGPVFGIAKYAPVWISIPVVTVMWLINVFWL